MAAGVGSSKMASDDVKMSSDIAPTLARPLSPPTTMGGTIVEIVPLVDGTTSEKSGALSEGPHANIV